MNLNYWSQNGQQMIIYAIGKSLCSSLYSRLLASAKDGAFQVRSNAAVLFGSFFGVPEGFQAVLDFAGFLGRERF